VIGAFNREFIKSGIFPQSFYKMTQKLHDDRQSGDYAIFTTIDYEMARRNIEDATMIVDTIAEYIGVKE